MDADSAPDSRVFMAQRNSAARLRRMLNEKGIKVTQRQLPPPSAAERAPELAWLEKQLFSRSSEAFPGDYSKNAIQLHAAANPADEAIYCAEILIKKHADGIPWSRMAVALPTPPSAMLNVTLQSAGIPVYLTRKSNIMRHGLCRLLMACLHAISDGWQQDDVLEIARSGFSGLSDDECQLLENYALEHGIRRKKWQLPFTRGENAAEMEELRIRLLTPVITLHDSLISVRKTSDGRHKAEASLEAVFKVL